MKELKVVLLTTTEKYDPLLIFHPMNISTAIFTLLCIIVFIKYLIPCHAIINKRTWFFSLLLLNCHTGHSRMLSDISPHHRLGLLSCLFHF